MQLILKWLRRAAIAVLAIALLAVIGVAFTLSTETGTRWAINRIDAFIPGSIQMGQFDGTLWAGLQIRTLVYSDSPLEVRASDLTLDISWSSVAAGTLSLNVLNAKSLEYRGLVARDATPGPFELAMDPLPLSIGVSASRIDRFTMSGDGEPTEILKLVIENAILNGNALNVRMLSAEFSDINVSLTDLDTKFDGDVPLEAHISWSLADGSWSGSGAFRGNLASLEFDHAVAGPYPATLSGDLKLLQRIQPEIDALINWQRWSINDYVLEDGEVRLRGNFDNYDASYDLNVQLPSGENARLSGTATGNTERLSAFEAHVANSDLSADLEGSLAWRPSFVAEGRVHASGFDPHILVETLAGRLDADAHVRFDDIGNLNITNATVTGVLNDAPINASGNVAVTPGQVSCDACLIAVGINRVSVDGASSSAGLALTLSVDAPSLDLLWPGLGGSLNGEGRLAGSRNLPQFSGELRGQQLRFADWSADEIVVSSRGSTADEINLVATVSALLNAGNDLGSFTLTGNGAPNQLNLEIDWAFRGFDISTSGIVQQSDELIEGEITHAMISELNTGNWLLNGRPRFQIRGSDVVVDAHAWSNMNGEFRVSQFSRVDDQTVLTANLVDLPLSMTNAFLPENFKLQGSASAEIDVGQSSGTWTGSVSWRQADTVLSVVESDGLLTNVSVPRASLDIDLKDAGAIMAVALTVEPGVTGELDLTMSRLSRDSPITAELRLQGSEWDWIPALIPAIDRFQGDISATVSATGPLTAPALNGNLNWREGSLVVPALNVPVTDIDVTVAGSSAGAATVRGSAKAGDGDLLIDGRFEDLTQSTRSVRVSLSGEAAEIVNWPEYHLWASPDLVVVGTSAGWTISGSLEVPRADIVVRELPDEAIEPSPDVTVLGREETAAAPIRVSGEARLVLGEKVQVQAFGLDTGLQGTLEIKMANDRPIAAEGQVTLVGGIFTAYGQKLTIQEGTLTFTGALDNALVNVRAVRIIESFDGPVTAGIHLQGRAQSISSSVFSDPAMAEADALSYLVVGRPLSQATESEGNELSNAAVALGVRQAARITDQIGQVLGLDQLALAGDGGDTTALVAGKQLNSRLHARYAYGVFSRLGTLLLRYKMSRWLSLEAGAGEIQSINILYTVEKQ